MDPTLNIEAQDVFISVQIFQGRIKARLNQARVRHPSLGEQGLAVEALAVDFPIQGVGVILRPIGRRHRDQSAVKYAQRCCQCLALSPA